MQNQANSRLLPGTVAPWNEGYSAGFAGKPVSRRADYSDDQHGAWVAGHAEGDQYRQERQAYKLGSIDAYAGRPERDMDDDGSAWLMTELGQHGPTTAGNFDGRAAACDSYCDGYHAALSAMGGTG